MKTKLLHSSRKLRVGAAIAAMASIASGAYFLITTNKGKPLSVPAYEVLRVIDGDSVPRKTV
ncbi:MAG: hypothetical protein AAB800_01180 [Patescibacteria group bacterium]